MKSIRPKSPSELPFSHARLKLTHRSLFLSYQPPMFREADLEKERLYFATRSRNQAPELSTYVEREPPALMSG